MAKAKPADKAKETKESQETSEQVLDKSSEQFAEELSAQQPTEAPAQQPTKAPAPAPVKSKLTKYMSKADADALITPEQKLEKSKKLAASFGDRLLKVQYANAKEEQWKNVLAEEMKKRKFLKEGEA